MLRYKTVWLVALTASLGGCVVAGPSVEETLLDPTVTGSVEPQPKPADLPADSDVASDRRIVRNAVSSADLEKGGGRYAWSNPETGSSGVIVALSQERDGDNICRSFETLRQRFDGIALYQGRACSVGAGEWALLEFAKR
ncbi:RT0821/Lpp0805 family surface protein [Jiella endophytica]|nr:RT0821/Lpp0805 family surface protein [Jiella endophytica]